MRGRVAENCRDASASPLNTDMKHPSSPALVRSMMFWFGAPHIAALYITGLEVQQIAIPLIMPVALYHLGDALKAVAGMVVLYLNVVGMGSSSRVTVHL